MWILPCSLHREHLHTVFIYLTCVWGLFGIHRDCAVSLNFILYSFQSRLLPFVFHFEPMSGCDPSFTEQVELIFHACALSVNWYGNVFQFNTSHKNVCNIKLVSFQCASVLCSVNRAEYWTSSVCRYSIWNKQHVFTPYRNIWQIYTWLKYPSKNHTF